MQIYGTKTVATIGPRKHITITYPAPRETLLGIPLDLPTSAPVTPQVSFTVEAGDIPALTGIDLSGVTLVAFLYFGGQNLIQTGQNIYVEPFVNGVSIGSGTNVSSQPYYTQQFTIADIHLGDLLEIYLWTDNPAEVVFDYDALAIAVSRPRVAPQGTVLLETHYLTFVQFPVLTLGAPDYNNARATNADNFDGNVSVELFDDLTIHAQCVDTARTVYRMYYGDRNTATPFEDTYTRPFYDPNSIPTDIAFYPTSIRVV